ncbi:MAG: hypothetical protein KAS82_06260 [Bacteroidales bacterium]|nr:hypothetical protein [Bacteroidales bacterium]
MTRHSSYSFIYNLQRIILLVFFVTTSIAISIPLAKLVTKLSPNHLYPLVITLLAYIIVVVVVGSMIHVISYIPFNLATAFDSIKNDIASGRINTIEQLGERITAFTVRFYNFSFLDISHAFLQTEGGEVMGHETNIQVENVLKEYKMLEKSRELDQITRAGKISLQGKNYQLYILPIWFGEQWLGYMALLSEKRISRFFQRFLMEYEENFLDDQIMHLVKFNKQ